MAIQLALEHACHRQETSVVLHTDSMTGLQVLEQPLSGDNIGLVTAILSSLQSLAVQGRRVRLNWITSHVGVAYNEAGDSAARRAATGPRVTQGVPPSLRQVKAGARRAATRHAHQAHILQNGKRKQGAWYAAATE